MKGHVENGVASLLLSTIEENIKRKENEYGSGSNYS